MTDKNKFFINFILVLTLAEIGLFFYGFFLPFNLEAKNAVGINLPRLLLTVLPYLFMMLAYFHRYWITAFVLKCIAFISESMRILCINYLKVYLIDINQLYISRIILSLEIIFLITSFLYIYKFKRLKDYPKFFNIKKL